MVRGVQRVEYEDLRAGRLRSREHLAYPCARADARNCWRFGRRSRATLGERGLIELVLSQPHVQLRAGQSQTFGGPGLVTAGVAHHLLDRLALADVQIVGVRYGGGPLAVGGGTLAVQRQVLGGNQGSLAQDRRALERVAKLPDVARPVVPQERVLGVTGQPRRRAAERLADVLQERVGEDQDVALAVTKRGNLD